MKKFCKDHIGIIIVVVLFLLAHIPLLMYSNGISWDGAVYVGMAKYLFSHGTIGVWEALRPVGLPIVLGMFWKLGVNPYIAGTACSMVMSVGVLILVYVVAERVRKGAGTVAALLLAASAVFLTFSSIPVTDIIASFFALLSLMLVYTATKNKHYFIAGLVAALAFLFRFPQGLTLVVGGLVIIAKMLEEKGKWPAKLERMIERGFSFTGGFFTLAVPFLVANYYVYGNAFLPFIEGTQVIKLYPSLYQKGLFFYPIELLKQNPLYVLFVLPIALYWKKSYRHLAVTTMTFAILIIGGYFMYEGHKEARYMLAFLPYIAVLSALGIAYVIERYKISYIGFYGAFGIVAFMAAAPFLVQGHKNPDMAALRTFNMQLQHVSSGRMLTTSPALLAYSDVSIQYNLYSDWNAAFKTYNAYRAESDYVMLNSCNLEQGCADNAQCRDNKENLLAALEKQEIKLYEAMTPSQCQLLLYKIRR
ncbi:MAG: glycosyltransferase family 39 protein [Patescibacteria group bacterium]